MRSSVARPPTSRLGLGALYDLLEQEVLPAFYDRDADGLPRSWLARMRASMRTLAPGFCAGRMLHDYLEQIYTPTAGS